MTKLKITEVKSYNPLAKRGIGGWGQLSCNESWHLCTARPGPGAVPSIFVDAVSRDRLVKSHGQQTTQHFLLLSCPWSKACFLVLSGQWLWLTPCLKPTEPIGLLCQYPTGGSSRKVSFFVWRIFLNLPTWPGWHDVRHSPEARTGMEDTGMWWTSWDTGVPMEIRGPAPT